MCCRRKIEEKSEGLDEKSLLLHLIFTTMEISSKYSPQEVEGKWYEHWMEKNYFHSTPDEREPYTIVIPPPNAQLEEKNKELQRVPVLMGRQRLGGR